MNYLKKIWRQTQKYCTNKPKQIKKSENIGTSLSFEKLEKQISERGIEEGGQVFISFYDNTNTKLGKTKQYSYCYDTSKNNWVETKDEKDCRNKWH